jgi:hypothetical protein
MGYWVHKVIKTVGLVLLCLTICLRAGAQSMEVSGSRVPLAEGNVLGAAFYEDKGMFIVQQSVLSTENGGLVIRFHRQLSSWNLKNHSMITRRVFEEAPQEASAYPCGRVETSARMHRVFLCSAGSYLEAIDPDTLGTVGTVAEVDNQHINDFAVDDLRARLLVLASWRDGSIRLTAYSLLNGDKQQEAVLPITNAKRMSLTFAPQIGLVGIAVDADSRSGGKADIYVCATDKTFGCANVTRIDPVSQISFLGQQLLVATSTFADNKNECILTVDPTARSVSHKYCSPSTGVHYAVGVVNKRYVVAFTGISRRKWFSEENKSVASSFSVWRTEIPQVAAVAKDPADYGAFQDEIRIVGSSTEPLFIAYQRVSSTLSLYSITVSN